MFIGCSAALAHQPSAKSVGYVGSLGTPEYPEGHLSTATSSPEGGPLESDHPGRDLPTPIIQRLELGWRNAPDRLQEAPVVVPVYSAVRLDVDAR